ncbi:MAG: rRNA adenine N-6-methyltransferase family protein, partial [Veillonella dispar]|nr:rRNA adenine N-6-methyltransferase family protein [Veillonella dispar]
MELLDFVIRQTDKYIDSIPRTERKKYGQFFTSIETAVFMASLFDIPENKSTLRILDTGAGTGILSAALIQRLEGISSLQKIYLVCYENDHQVLEVLRRNLDWIKTHSNIQIDYEIRNDNYILEQEKDYNCTSETDSNHKKFDMVIGNPPYMKIGKDAPEAKAMPDICYGAPNLYFLFIAMGVFNLFQKGELVYIVPRSWTS